MSKVIDIVSDLGEGFGAYTIADDNSLLELVSSANIACGFHAGDPRTMAGAVKQAVRHNVGIGAHPGFPDKAGFGRRNMKLTSEEVLTDTLYQIGALSAFVKAYGGTLQHVSPHGSLANLCVVDRNYAEAVAEAVALFDPKLLVVTQPGQLELAAKQKGLKVAALVFADRAYNEDGTLVSRTEPGAVIHDAKTVMRRCVQMAVEQTITTVTGKEIHVTGHSLLIHGDTAGSLQLARQIIEALQAAGVEIRKLKDWL